MCRGKGCYNTVESLGTSHTPIPNLCNMGWSVLAVWTSLPIQDLQI